MADETKQPKKKKGKFDEIAFKTKLERWWESDSGARKQIDWQWFLYDLWIEGHHHAKWDKGQQQIITQPKSTGRPKVMVNKIDSTLRAVTNYALRNRPKAEVTPVGMTEDDVDEVVKQNIFLDYMHDILFLRGKARGAVEESLGSGISWVQILFDEDAGDGKGEIVINEIDKYDLYWQKGARTPEESRRFTLAVSRNIEDLKSDEKYKDADWEKVQPDKQLSSSPLKERLLKLDVGDEGASNDKKAEGNVMVKEYWYMGDEDQGEDPDTWYICATAGKTQEIIRKPEPTDLTRHPFFRLCCASRKLSMVGKSWVKNLIPLNRRLNDLMSSLAEYNVVMNKGYWIADKGAGVRTITNNHGIIIEKKRGFDVTQGAVNPISSIIINEIELILQLFEDIGAIHDATMGRIPTGAKSGKALEALQTGDSNNLAEVVENTEIWLEEIYEYILFLAGQKYQFARDLTPTTKTGQREFLKVIGEDAEAAPDAATVIKKKNVVDVKITSYLAHTAEARREAIRELAGIIPDLDPQTILEVYEIGPIADIVKRIRENKQTVQTDELAMQQAQTQMQAPPQAGAQQAIAVIRQVLMGEQPKLPPGAGPEFIQYFDQFLQSEEAQQLDPQMLTTLQSLRDQVAQQPPAGAAG